MPVLKNFIPKRVVEQNPQIQKQRQNRVTWLGVVGAIITIATVVSVVVIFLYYQITLANLQSMRESVTRAEKIFEPSVILKLQDMETRLSSANTILGEHVALSLFFDSLQETTLPQVSFSEFNFLHEDGEYLVSMSGVATDYITIAMQSDIFAKNQFIDNHIFSDFRLNRDGTVQFSLSFTIPQSEILYSSVHRRTQPNNT